MVENQARKRPQPSFIEGKVRDPRIEEMQAKSIDQEDFTRLVRRAATYRVVPKPANSGAQSKKGGRDGRTK